MIGDISWNRFLLQTRSLLIIGVFIPFLALVDYPFKVTNYFPLFGVVSFEFTIFVIEMLIIGSMLVLTIRYLSILSGVASMSEPNRLMEETEDK